MMIRAMCDDVQPTWHGWCFSHRTLRLGRTITFRARAARCTRKPSPRPLPGRHFPRPASKSLAAKGCHTCKLIHLFNSSFVFIDSSFLFLLLLSLLLFFFSYILSLFILLMNHFSLWHWFIGQKCQVIHISRHIQKVRFVGCRTQPQITFGGRYLGLQMGLVQPSKSPNMNPQCLDLGQI